MRFEKTRAVLFTVAFVVGSLGTSLPQENSIAGGDQYINHGKDPIAIASGSNHNCILMEKGDVQCWGRNDSGQAEPYLEGNAIDIDAGGAHTCVVLENGNIDCWGSNFQGQSEPYFGEDAIGISTGFDHTCALLENGDVHCWGYNAYGQSEPYNNGDAIAITAGNWITCALLENGNVQCWGDGQHGVTAGYQGGDALRIDTLAYHVCALLENGNIHCWGNNWRGQSSNYSGGDAVGIAAGGWHSCALLENGNIFCWGFNSSEQTVPYWGEDAAVPAAGVFHTCALLANGNVHCWGQNDYGQGDTYFNTPPQNITVSATQDEGEIALAWEAPPWSDGDPPVTEYRIYIAENQSGPYEFLESVGANILNYTDSGLPDSDFYYALSAVNGSLEGRLSSNLPECCLPPPKNVEAMPGPGVGEITLNWQHPSTEDLITNYHIYRGNTDDSIDFLTEIGNTTTYVDTGLENGITSFYRISAVSNSGGGNLSDVTYATTYNLPDVPLELQALGGPGVGEITLTWDPPADDGGTPLVSYKIYRADTEGGPFQEIGTNPAETTEFLDEGLGNGESYHYEITALNLVGEGDSSELEEATTFQKPGPPEALETEPGRTFGEVILNWEPPKFDGGTPVDEYHVYRGTSDNGYSWVANVDGDTLTYTDQVTILTTYHYRVSAENIVGEGDLSSMDCTKPFPWIKPNDPDLCWVPP